MALKILQLLKTSARVFLSDRGNSGILDADDIIFEYGRLLVYKMPNGKIRLKIGSGNKTPSDLNYIGDGVVIKQGLTTAAFGSIPAGSDLFGQGFDEVIEAAAYAYQDVVLSNITINQSDIELGQDVNSTITLNCTINNSSNLEAGATAIVSSSPSIFTPQSFDPSSQYIINGVSGSFDEQTDIVISVTILGKNGETSINTKTIQVSPKIWTGSSALAVIPDFTALKALGTSKLARTRQGTYTFSNNYSHFAIPSTINTSGIGFIDVDINTGADLLNYATDVKQDLVVVSDYGIQVTYKMWRSSYPFGGTTKCRIT